MKVTVNHCNLRIHKKTKFNIEENRASELFSVLVQLSRVESVLSVHNAEAILKCSTRSQPYNYVDIYSILKNTPLITNKLGPKDSTNAYIVVCCLKSIPLSLLLVIMIVYNIIIVIRLQADFPRYTAAVTGQLCTFSISCSKSNIN